MRSAEVRVIGSDRVRYSVYEGGKLYILNTDYDMPVSVRIEAYGKTAALTLDSLELRTVDLGEI